MITKKWSSWYTTEIEVLIKRKDISDQQFNGVTQLNVFQLITILDDVLLTSDKNIASHLKIVFID